VPRGDERCRWQTVCGVPVNRHRKTPKSQVIPTAAVQRDIVHRYKRGEALLRIQAFSDVPVPAIKSVLLMHNIPIREPGSAGTWRPKVYARLEDTIDALKSTVVALRLELSVATLALTNAHGKIDVLLRR